jgi:2',3'-cyclic-nucleotide 2'-phosphodiesterase (5'-nucleotidase family)
MKNSTFVSIFVFFTAVCGSCGRVQPKIVSAELIEVSATEHSQNNEFWQWISPFKTALDKVMGVEIGVSAQKMEKGAPESLLGNFVTDVMLDYARNHGKKVDFAITNLGGLREALPAGVIAKGDVYKMFPFDNELVILTISGKNVERLCQEIAAQGGQATAGIKMKIDTVLHIGCDIKINNLPLDASKNYRVLTTDYLSFGNDKLFALADYSSLYTFKKPLREIIIEYIKNHKKINPIQKHELEISSIKQ